ncbi:senescence-associated protein [Anaeramoeba flamelloides]|uniref:Senescence-associated protein n=1 Tax=Anaeramoeba flamelloides TaxID=1746091 RepID=A0ABQ8XKY3_9EUKA|nr:senescence-associated protein [Anaeramoeba flamelloides]KAJ6233302.1 senescence-associated protein [Anaeramoeba flamelloides]KAJ6240380.1 senescence-associated protein [Anaeramoeba flamelloides]
MESKNLFFLKLPIHYTSRDKLKMIGRADIEESNGGVAMNARPPQASYPSGNFSDTSNFIAFPEYLKDR